MDWSQIVQLIINLFLVLATFGLVIVTTLYTLSTHKMAKEMKRQSEMMQKEFEIRISPLIEVKVVKWITNVLTPALHLIVINRSFYRVKFDYFSIRWWHIEDATSAQTEDRPINTWIECGKSEARLVRVHFSKLAQFRNALDVKEKGRVSFECHFSDIQKNNFIITSEEIIPY
jgi:hypothetical protein